MLLYYIIIFLILLVKTVEICIIMKKKLVLFSILVVVSTAVSAQFSSYVKIGLDKSIIPDINYFGQKMINDQWGMFGFALVEPKMAKAYGGVIYSPAKWIKLRVGLGLEQSPSLYRLAAGVLINFNNFTFSLAGEKGKGDDNYWYKTFVKYNLRSWDLGIISWRYNATGLFLGYNFTPWLSLWTVPGYDFKLDIHRIIVGVDVKI